MDKVSFTENGKIVTLDVKPCQCGGQWRLAEQLIGPYKVWKVWCEKCGRMGMWRILKEDAFREWNMLQEGRIWIKRIE